MTDPIEPQERPDDPDLDPSSGAQLAALGGIVLVVIGLASAAGAASLLAERGLGELGAKAIVLAALIVVPLVAGAWLIVRHRWTLRRGMAQAPGHVGRWGRKNNRR